MMAAAESIARASVKGNERRNTTQIPSLNDYSKLYPAELPSSRPPLAKFPDSPLEQIHWLMDVRDPEVLGQRRMAFSHAFIHLVGHVTVAPVAPRTRA
jgi:hypothetical protein